MKLYICWGTFKTPRPGGHPCANAYHALKDAGHEFETVKSYGFGPLPDMTEGRKRVKELTGQSWVPALEFDDGTALAGSEEIAAWAKANASG
jgi:hypothetical protein